MPITLSHIIQSTGAELNGQASLDDNFIIHEFYFDTRKIYTPKHALFLCLAKSNQQIAQHVKLAEKKGISVFLVPKNLDYKSPNSLFLKVPDVLEAFQLLAKVIREKYDIPMVGITGSNGKTIIKEWLATVLEQGFNLLKSPASYNSQLGVPLSVSKLTKVNQLAIFEAGISKPNEMQNLEEIIQPTIGILSNIGDAHSEGFENDTEKLLEKLILFKNCKYLILEETPLINAHNIAKNSSAEIIRWSMIDPTIDHFVEVNKASDHSIISIKSNSSKFRLPFVDSASIKNCIHVIFCSLHLNLSAGNIQKRLNLLEPVSMRLSMTKGRNNSLIINDSYNADMTSLINALEFANNQKQHRSFQIILSDFDQISYGSIYQSKLKEILQQFPLDHIHYIGDKFDPSIVGIPFSRYKKMKDLKSYFEKNPLKDTLILLKGARRFQLESLVNQFKQKAHRTQLTISLNAINHNIRFFRQLLNPETEIMAVIKASAYGSDSVTLAKELIKVGVERLAVAYFEEAKELRDEGISAPLMIMNPDPAFSDQFNRYNLELEIFNCEQLEAILQNGAPNIKIHIKIDSGMNRLGFKVNDVNRLIHILQENPSIKVLSIFSHFAASEDTSQDAFTQNQNDTFESLYKMISSALGFHPQKHICNSNAAIRFPKFHYDMVRVGIGLYGYVNHDDTEMAHELSSYVAQVKKIEAGESVGYNRSFIAKSAMKIATISMGYADGLSRKLGNGAFHFRISNKLVPTVGKISMDTCSIDVTGLDVLVGDEVIIFDSFESFYEMAKISEQTSYEMISSIGPRVSKEFIKE